MNPHGRSPSWPLWLMAPALLWLAPPVPARPPAAPSPVVRNWTSSRQIRGLAEWRGELWAATAGGVLRIARRGARVTKQTTADGLLESDVLQVQPWGERLVAVTRRGLAAFDGRRWAALPSLPETDAGHPPAVTPFRDGLAAASGEELYELGPGTDAWTRLPAPEAVRRAGTAGGRLWAVGATATWSSTDGREWTRGPAAPDEPPVALLAAEERPVLATRQALYLLERQNWRRVAVTGLPGATHLAGIAPDGDRLLLAVHGSGLWSLDPACPERGLTPAAEGPAAEIAGARGAARFSGELWVGTTDGLRRRGQGRWQQLALATEPPGNVCAALARYAGALWLATQDGGVARLANGRWETGVGPERAHVLQFAAAGGRLWARHPDGSVSTLEGKRWQPYAPPTAGRLSWVSGLWPAVGGLWLGSWGGAARWSGGAGEPAWHGPGPAAGEPVTALAEHRGELWLGTARQGVVAGLPGGEWRIYHEGNGLRDGWITALASDGERLWAATFNGGLATWDGERWSHPDPLPTPAGRKITSMTVDRRGALWAGTRGGLARFHRGEWRAWTVADGLAGDEVQCLLADGDSLWAGTRTGLTELRYGRN